MLILVLLIGFFLISRISVRFSLLEKVGFGLPVGLGLVTVCMVLLDWANVPLNRTSMSILTGVLLLVSVGVNYNQLRLMIEDFKPRSVNLQWFNLLWLGIIGLVVYIEAVNFAKCMVYPTYDRDSLAAFDTIGFVCAQEHTFHLMSIFDPQYCPHMHGPGSSISYLPMIQLSYAYVYIFGAVTSKAIPGYLFLTYLIGFYGLCCRRTTHLGAALTLLGVLFAPELISFASMSITNVMQACVASAGLVYVCQWIQRRENHLLWMGFVLLAVNNWMRAEGVVFIGVAWLLVAIVSLKRRSWKTVVWPLLAFVPLVLWMVYSNACGLTSESAVITHPYWDSQKLYTIFYAAWALLSGAAFYGWTFHVLAYVLIIHLVIVAIKLKYPFGPRSRATDFVVPVALLLCIVGYYLVLYQVDYKWDSMENVLAYSAKRFNFCFVPIAWYYIVSAQPVHQALQWVENHIGLGKTISLRGK